MKLQFGFENTPYAQRYSKLPPYMQKRKPRVLSPAQQTYGQGKTAGDVALEIEKKFGVVEMFFKLEENFIVDAFEEAHAMGMALGMGSGSWGVAWDPSVTLEPRFRRSLSARRFDGLIPGVPTQHSIQGVTHLRQTPFKKGATSRPSFIDTGLYQRSFKAWMEY